MGWRCSFRCVWHLRLTTCCAGTRQGFGQPWELGRGEAREVVLDRAGQQEEKWGTSTPPMSPEHLPGGFLGLPRFP